MAEDEGQAILYDEAKQVCDSQSKVKNNRKLTFNSRKQDYKNLHVRKTSKKF